MTRVRPAAPLQCHVMNSRDKAPWVRPNPSRRDDSSDPAIGALTELLQSERATALADEPELVEERDPSRVWLLWFAIGATDAICNLVQRDADAQRNQVFRQAVSVIFDGSGQSLHGHQAHIATADARLIELFESAGAAAVQACMAGDKRLGYYREALRVSADQGVPPLLS
jgi:hypothetical protein